MAEKMATGEVPEYYVGLAVPEVLTIAQKKSPKQLLKF